MGAIIGAAAGAAGDLLGGIISGKGSAAQRGWEARMSNTAYQRAVIDMKKAGLNPMMMFSHGGPESTPTGTNPGEAYGSGVAGAGSKVMQAMAMQADIDLKQANAKNIAADTLNKAAAGAELTARADLANASAAKARKEVSWMDPLNFSSLALQRAETSAEAAKTPQIEQEINESRERIAKMGVEMGLSSAQTKVLQEGMITRFLGTSFTDNIIAQWHKLLSSETVHSAQDSLRNSP